MKTGYYLLCMLLFVACKGTQKGNAVNLGSKAAQIAPNIQDSLHKTDSLKAVAQKAAFKQYKLNDDYTVIDTGLFNCGTMDGLYAIVKQKGQTADTIHLGLDMLVITQGKYMYLTLTKCENEFETEDEWPGILYVLPHQYVIRSSEGKSLLENLTAGFDNYKSAPNVINRKIFFWQYAKQSNGMFKVNAAMYNPETGKTESRYLFTGDLSDSEHIFRPFEKDGQIVFDWENRLWKFSSDFRLLN